MSNDFAHERFITLRGDSLERLKERPDNSADSIVTDPPSGIKFMGLEWDSDKGGRDAWIDWLTEIMREAFRVLKPGGYAFVWALPKTSHWTATAVENAGFEIRDKAAHMFGSGFPKSMDVATAIDLMFFRQELAKHRPKALRFLHRLFTPRPSDHWRKLWLELAVARFGPLKGTRSALRVEETHDIRGGSYGSDTSERAPVEIVISRAATEEAEPWEGWETALKPGHEDWILARKPLEKPHRKKRLTVAENVLKHGVGAINIEACRVGDDLMPAVVAGDAQVGTFERDEMVTPEREGRFPSNVLLSHSILCFSDGCHYSCPVRELDAQGGLRKSGSRKAGVRKGMGYHGAEGDGWPAITGDSGGASRYYQVFDTDELLEEIEIDVELGFAFLYTPKPSKREKNEGLDELPDRVLRRVNSGGLENDPKWAPKVVKNNHPTSKSVALMRWLSRLITPPGGTVLDPFMGSGTTGVAAMREGFKFIGVEKESSFHEIATARIVYRAELEKEEA